MSRKRKKSKSGSHRPTPSAAPSSSSASSSGGGGSMMRLRGGLQGMFAGKKSNKPKTVFDRVVDVGFWIVLAAAVAFVLYSRFFRRSQ
jgi:hypothetical protein